MEFREAIDRDVRDLRRLADWMTASSGGMAIRTDVLAGLATGGNDFLLQERQLDAAAWALRKDWLALAHRPADNSPKSPCAGQSAHVELDVSLLENRRKGYMQSAEGWSTDLVLCRSGQAALSGLLQFAIAQWGATGALGVVHDGAYFETASLIDAWPRRVLERRKGDADIVIAEPVWCDGSFGLTADRFPARHALFLDTTMAGPAYDMASHLKGDCPLVVAYSSGLKLDQAGLELANVGIVRIYARNGRAEAHKVAEALRRIRALTGTGLTLDELSALSAPWFMERSYVDGYTSALFANNRALAASIGNRSAIFASACHPSLLDSAAEAPFCALELRDPTPERYAALSARVEAEIERRGLLASRGGSFGFRGHRFELIEPEPGQGRTFLRIALGWRDGHSRQGLCDLFAEFAQEGFSPAGR
jgi:hypothetical protein